MTEARAKELDLLKDINKLDPIIKFIDNNQFFKISVRLDPDYIIDSVTRKESILDRVLVLGCMKNKGSERIYLEEYSEYSVDTKKCFINDENGWKLGMDLMYKRWYELIELFSRGNRMIILDTPEKRHEHRGQIAAKKFGF